MNYDLLTVWNRRFFGVQEKCKKSDIGYIGIDTGKIYSYDDHYHSEQFLAKVISVDNKNETGMYHLYEDWSDDNEENAKLFKIRMIGRPIIVEKAHYAGNRTVYRSVYPICEYWTDNEIDIIGPYVTDIPNNV